MPNAHCFHVGAYSVYGALHGPEELPARASTVPTTASAEMRGSVAKQWTGIEGIDQSSCKNCPLRYALSGKAGCTG